MAAAEAEETSRPHSQTLERAMMENPDMSKTSCAKKYGALLHMMYVDSQDPMRVESSHA